MTGPSSLPPLRLLPGEERRIEGGHLWVFSNEVDTAKTPLTAFEPGTVARIVSAREKFLGFGYVNPHALIATRLLGRDPAQPPSQALLVARLKAALALREGLYDRPWYRLVYGESDLLPGLVLDRYGDTIVGQIGTAGIEALRSEIVAAV